MVIVRLTTIGLLLGLLMPSVAEAEAEAEAEAGSGARAEPEAAQPDASAEDTPPHPGDPPPEGEADPADLRTLVVHDEEEPHDSDRGASQFHIDRELLEAAPHAEAAELLHTAPGVYVGRGEGGAVAHRYVLRGFDADHGQDIEMRVGGLPINLPSHLHGQGYADLGFLIADVVDDVHVAEGIYDPRQGDFAVAGSFDIHLGVHRRGWRVASSYGRFNTFDQLLLWAPRDQHEQTFAAVKHSRSDGFGDNRGGQSTNAIVQMRMGPSDHPWDHRVIAFMHAARYDHAGVVRRDDVDAGRVDFLGVYPYASARGQDAMSTRVMAGEFSHYHGSKGEAAQLGLWLGYDAFRIEQNFTGFTQTSQVLDNVSGRGDLNQQLNRSTSAGLQASYRSQRYHLSDWVHGAFELGLSGRFDRVDQQQSLIDAAVRNQIWDERVDARVHGTDLGMYADTDLWLTQYLRLRVGARADALYYDVDDRLGNFVPSVRPDDESIEGFRRSAAGLAIGPRTSADLRPLRWLSIRAAYGEGFRSPQARTLEDGERAPFTKVRSADLGARIFDEDRHSIAVSGYWTRLSDDVAFDPEEGRLERVGASRRMGVVVHLQTRPVKWVTGGLSFTYVDAELLEPPPATAEQPQPPFVRGQALPFVPPVLARADLGIHGPLARKGRAWELGGRIGAGFTYMSPRPLPFGARADPLALLDLGMGLSLGPLDLGASFFNLLDRRYATVEYAFASHWDPDAPRTRAPARHSSAGSPFSFLFTLGLSL